MINEQFEQDLSSVINRHSIDNELNTPDYKLAEFLCLCLEIFKNTNKKKSETQQPEPKLKAETTNKEQLWNNLQVGDYLEAQKTDSIKKGEIKEIVNDGSIHDCVVFGDFLLTKAELLREYDCVVTKPPKAGALDDSIKKEILATEWEPVSFTNIELSRTYALHHLKTDEFVTGKFTKIDRQIKLDDLVLGSISISAVFAGKVYLFDNSNIADYVIYQNKLQKSLFTAGEPDESTEGDSQLNTIREWEKARYEIGRGDFILITSKCGSSVLSRVAEKEENSILLESGLRFNKDTLLRTTSFKILHRAIPNSKLTAETMKVDFVYEIDVKPGFGDYSPVFIYVINKKMVVNGDGYIEFKFVEREVGLPTGTQVMDFKQFDTLYDIVWVDASEEPIKTETEEEKKDQLTATNREILKTLIDIERQRKEYKRIAAEIELAEQGQTTDKKIHIYKGIPLEHFSKEFITNHIIPAFIANHPLGRGI